MKIIITGGAGFIGSAMVRYLYENTSYQIGIIDKLTYASNLHALPEQTNNKFYQLYQVDITDHLAVEQIITDFRPDAIMHFAAESHVDRSIEKSTNFIQTNIIGTYTLLEVARHYWERLPSVQKDRFRFHHISTDEVFGDLDQQGNLFTESSLYMPSSPYSASKAASDHLVQAWRRTYGLPTIITHSSNNYGPYQHVEKLIPKIITRALAGLPIPIYGDGKQVRDWLYVDDHVQALALILTKASAGSCYNLGGQSERTNIDVVKAVCYVLEQLVPHKDKRTEHYENLICYVADRIGHDRRYAVNIDKVASEIGWVPQTAFDAGIDKTVRWYLDYHKPI